MEMLLSHSGTLGTAGYHCGLCVSAWNSAWLGNCTAFSSAAAEVTKGGQKGSMKLKILLLQENDCTGWVKLRAALSQHIAQQCLCAAPAGSAAEITSQNIEKIFLDCTARLLGDVKLFLWDEV